MLYDRCARFASAGKEMTSLLSVAMLFAACGCGGQVDGRVAVYPVTGTVTVKGQPAEGAEVVLFVVGEALRGPEHPLPTGVVGPDGKFTLGSYGIGDGAPAGEYQVTIVWPDVDKAADSGREASSPRDRLKDRYAVPSQSGLTATVEAGPTELPPFKLP